MSNNWFRFKQFEIAQDNCGMKITTDACIQGAWTPVLPFTHRALDIGTGTGLLALMLAQRSEGLLIDAIEADLPAAKQAAENCSDSPWKERIEVVFGDVKEFKPVHKYNLIICNPPFFNKSLLGPGEQRNKARHSQSLNYTDILNVLDANSEENGYASILFPGTEFMEFEKIMNEGGWKAFRKLNISHSKSKPVSRIVGLFSKSEANHCLEETLVIKNEALIYTREFTALLAPFYLAL